ncbi:NAD dependent epimerase/dehydratase, partial [Rasamsonia emersonii CBS 393.64]
MSLCVALRKLGYTSYHMAECWLDSANDSMSLWHEAIEAKFNGKGRYVALLTIQAVTDIPCILFVDELLAAYPHAQIILTNRPVEIWVPSIKRSFYTILSWKRWRLLQFLDRRDVHHYIPILRSSLTVWTGGNWQDETRLPDGYAAHYAHVRAAAKAQGREVLEFRVQDGWEPLCQFLGKEVPDEPFPHVNEGDWVVGLHYTIFWIQSLRVVWRVLKWTAPVAAAGAAWWWYRRLAPLLTNVFPGCFDHPVAPITRIPIQNAFFCITTLNNRVDY